MMCMEPVLSSDNNTRVFYYKNAGIAIVIVFGKVWEYQWPPGGFSIINYRYDIAGL